MDTASAHGFPSLWSAEAHERAAAGIVGGALGSDCPESALLWLVFCPACMPARRGEGRHRVDHAEEPRETGRKREEGKGTDLRVTSYPFSCRVAFQEPLMSTSTDGTQGARNGWCWALSVNDSRIHLYCIVMMPQGEGCTGKRSADRCTCEYSHTPREPHFRVLGGLVGHSPLLARTAFTSS